MGLFVKINNGLHLFALAFTKKYFHTLLPSILKKTLCRRQFVTFILQVIMTKAQES